MKKILTLAMVFSITLSFPSLALAQVNPAPNPTLGNACDGLDISLVIDRSGSIGSDMQTVIDGAKDFVNAFLSNTPSKIGVVSFASTATTHLGLTDNVANLEAAIDGLTSSGNTNWEDGLIQGRELLETPPTNPTEDDRDDATNPDLMVVFTDGIPTASNGPLSHLDDAITAANRAKVSTSTAGIRIVAVGVGGAVQANLEAISGTNVATTTNDIDLDTDVIMTDFENLGTTLANLATALCDEPPDDCGCQIGPVIIGNKNKAVVVNHVSAGANTGDNYAGGADGGDGGDGGDIKNRGDDVINSSTGRGGAGGSAGEFSGGTVLTGNAGATAGAINVVNTNVTRIGADEDDDEGAGNVAGPVINLNRNRAIVLNGAGAGANSGDNAAKGADGGEGGEGGDIKNKDGEGSDVNNSHTGAGGTGGTSGEGGYVWTGDAGSTAGVINIVNRNRLRIR